MRVCRQVMELTGGCPCNVNSSLSMDCVACYYLVERGELPLVLMIRTFLLLMSSRDLSRSSSR